MPMYRFVITNGSASSELVDLPDCRQARRDATQTLGEMLRGDPEELWASGVLSVIVQDESGLTFFSVDAVGTDAPAFKGKRT